ncbi:MAG: aminoacetone oxidase family FAD-binding enzyme [Lachnospiraceae bacterium]|nr:aminoacetone oxidase family FAD-binding enzyme [Lachnospiraceae bacterium]
MPNRKVCIIGGGAAGLAAAVTAAKAGAQVVVLEHGERVGKKLLSTGNGRCNYTNAVLSADRYFSGCPAAVETVLLHYPTEKILAFFENIGVSPVQKDGYYYPASGQAAAVLSCLLSECGHRSVEICCNTQVNAVTPVSSGFSIDSNEGRFFCNSLILACGGQAAPATGSDGSGYVLAKGLGHSIRRPFPALTALKAEARRLKGLAGLRAHAGVSLYINGRLAGKDVGEVQFVEGGLSGIVVFQLSHRAVEAFLQKKRVELRLNFLPEMTSGQAASFFARRRRQLGYKELAEWGIGLFHKKLWLQLIKEAGMPPLVPVWKQEPAAMAALQAMTRDFRVPMSGYFGFERAQVSAGGVDLREINPDTMESKKRPGLYLCGELLDVDGLCGGYNLHWAWASAMAAAAAAAHRGRNLP